MWMAKLKNPEKTVSLRHSHTKENYVLWRCVVLQFKAHKVFVAVCLVFFDNVRFLKFYHVDWTSMAS